MTCFSVYTVLWYTIVILTTLYMLYLITVQHLTAMVPFCFQNNPIPIYILIFHDKNFYLKLLKNIIMIIFKNEIYLLRI